MFRKSLKKADYVEENIFWITMSDLLLGLMIIFLILFIMTMVGFSQAKFAEKSAQAEMASVLADKFEKNNINVNINKMSGQIEISDLELFDLGSYKLSNKGKAYLDKFFPIYIDTIFSNPEVSDKVENIVIEGHTDSQMFKGLKSEDEQYAKNLELSSMRATEVANYVFKTNYNKKYSKYLRKALVTEGKSNIEPVLTNNKEDFDKSRRVELEVRMKAGENVLEKMLNQKGLL